MVTAPFQSYVCKDLALVDTGVVKTLGLSNSWVRLAIRVDKLANTHEL